ncbi:hypothetical protein ACFR9U_07865 [Halorientalis brevis]|uniref:DUF4383 domain-containing protein n=1 Tax=Halorientalis brevis TaxID=1126241 RepID=A0ABD6C9Y4_9EURY|nr:hypothetical protein [Halorientalis brevis]
MDVHAAVTSRRTRVGFLVLALLAYAGLMGYGAIAGSAAAFALAQVLVGAVLLVAVGFAVAVTGTGTELLRVAAAGYLLAGLAIGYSGLAALRVVPSFELLEPAGDVALLIALGAYLYQREVAGRDNSSPERSSE